MLQSIDRGSRRSRVRRGPAPGLARTAAGPSGSPPGSTPAAGPAPPRGPPRRRLADLGERAAEALGDAGHGLVEPPGDAHLVDAVEAGLGLGVGALVDGLSRPEIVVTNPAHSASRMASRSARAAVRVVVVTVLALSAQLRLAGHEHLGLVVDQAACQPARRRWPPGRLARGRSASWRRWRSRALHRVAQHGDAEQVRERLVGHPHAGVHRHVAEVGPVLGGHVEEVGRVELLVPAQPRVGRGGPRPIRAEVGVEHAVERRPARLMTWTRYTPGSRTAGDRIAARRRPSAYARRRTSRVAGSGAVRGARYRTLVWRSTAMRRTETSRNT